MPFPSEQLVLAQGLTLPMLLWGVALGSLPIIIHLLHKRKYRETSWAAMRFLMEAARKNSRRVRLEQLLLLVVRTLILLFLVGALQGFYLESTSRGFDEREPTHHVIVVDASFSMRYRPNQQSSVYERARKTALEIVEGARPGDLLNVVLITGFSKRGVITTPAKSKNWVRSRIELSKPMNNAIRPLEMTTRRNGMPASPTHETGKLYPTLREIAQILKKTSLPRKRVYFIGDFQKNTWIPVQTGQRERINRLMKSLAQHAQLKLIDLGSRGSENIAITQFDSKTPYVIAKRPLELIATLRNFGRDFALKKRLELYVDGILRDVRSVDLPPNSTQKIRFEYPPQNGATIAPPLEKGEYYFEVRLQDDRLPLDNVRGLAIPVKNELKVLLVDGNPSAPRKENPTFFLRHALRPAKASEDWQGIFQPKVITETELIGMDFSDIDCIFLCNLSLIQENELRKLRAFVENGGGLVICLGDQVRVNHYNEVLFREDDGILPVRLETVVKTPHRLETTNLSHPIMDPFRGSPGAGLERVICERYFRVIPRKSSRTRVVLRFKPSGNKTTGDPAILESALGQGQVVLVTTAFQAKWSTWPVTHSFLPLINELVYFTVPGRWMRRQTTVGEPLERGFSAASVSLPDSLNIQKPGGETQSIPLGRQDRWRTGQQGAVAYSKAPQNGKPPSTEPLGRIAPKTPVRKLRRKGQFVLIQWNDQTGWVRNNQLERIGYPGIYFSETYQRGEYRLLLPPELGVVEKYAVNIDTQESDLSPATENSLRAETLAGVRFDYLREWREESSEFHVAKTQQSQLSRWLLIAALCLMIIEQVMAWKFLPGLFLLAVFVSLEFSRQAYQWRAMAGFLVAVLLLGTIAFLGFHMRKKRQREPRMRSLSP
ncbi:MAG: hypothetical protein Tsb009_38480 [Planctomycetaceae bacterium]